MERYRKGAELAAWHHGYQAEEFAIAKVCPYSTGSNLAKAWHEGYQKAREEQSSPAFSKPQGTNDQN